jgi:hypothetical protein
MTSEQRLSDKEIQLLRELAVGSNSELTLRAIVELADVQQALAYYADQFDGGEIARKVLGITKGENDGN